MCVCVCVCVQSLAVSGLGSGLTEGVIIAPFERVKVYMQAQRSRTSEVTLGVMHLHTNA